VSQTIGILGGMGPHATLDFMRMLLNLSNKTKESENYRVVVDNNPQIPSRTRAFLFGEEDPTNYMIEGVKSLISAGADFIVVPCNSAHYFLPKVFETVPFPYIDIVKATSNKIVESECLTVGLLGGEVTVEAQLYEKELNEKTISVIHVPSSEQHVVRSVIEDVKAGNISEATFLNMESLLSAFSEQGVEAVVLACTELQAVMPNIRIPVNIKIFDSVEILALAAIELAELGLTNSVKKKYV
jgi:aspartate racemase